MRVYDVVTVVCVADALVYLWLRLFADIALFFRRDAAGTRLMVRAVQELWLLAGPGLVFVAVYTWQEFRAGSPIDGLYFVGVVVSLVRVWWPGRDWPDDENRWWRRARKAAARVVAAGRRLVVVLS